MLHANAIASAMSRPVTRPGSSELVDSPAVLLVPPVGRDVAPAVGLAPVRVGEPVGVREPADADDRPRPPFRVVGPGERGHAPGDIRRRLGDGESRPLAAGVAPVLL